MKKVEIFKPEFDDLVYPAVALALHSEDIAQLRINDRVLTKLEAKGVENSIPPTEEESKVVGKLIPLFVLKGKKATFEFEDTEAAYLVEKLKGLLPKVHGRVLRPLLPIFTALKKEDDE